MFLTKEVKNFLKFKNKILNLNFKKWEYAPATKLILTYLWEVKEVKTFEEYKKEIKELYNELGFFSRENPILAFLLSTEGAFQETETGKLFRSNNCGLKQHILRGTAFMLLDTNNLWPLVEESFLKDKRKDYGIIFQEIMEKRRKREEG